MQLNTPTLSYNTLLNLLVKMLQSPWGSSHTYQDHHDTTNTCLLCKATSLWFSLATKLLEENEQRHRAMEEEEATDLPSPSGERPSHVQLQRSSMRKLALKISRKLTHSESPDDFSPPSSLPAKLGSAPERHSARWLEESKFLSLGNDGGKGQGVEEADFGRDFPPAEPKPKKQFRKMGSSSSRSDYQVRERGGGREGGREGGGVGGGGGREGGRRKRRRRREGGREGGRRRRRRRRREGGREEEEGGREGGGREGERFTRYMHCRSLRGLSLRLFLCCKRKRRERRRRRRRRLQMCPLSTRSSNCVET